MFETIVWATDGSELADAALPLVEELARTHGSKIVAVHATQLFRGGRFGGGPLLADDDDLRSKIRDQVDELRAAGFVAELEVKAGDRQDTAHLISAAAKELDADLIVVGTHGRGAIGSAVAGSVTRQLMASHHALCSQCRRSSSSRPASPRAPPPAHQHEPATRISASPDGAADYPCDGSTRRKEETQ